MKLGSDHQLLVFKEKNSPYWRSVQAWRYYRARYSVDYSFINSIFIAKLDLQLSFVAKFHVCLVIIVLLAQLSIGEWA